MTVLATAGHVSHGKSSLIRRLTGTDPDRLPDEKRLHRTIELGFAFLRRPAGLIGFVDVPGHSKLTNNMLMGLSEVSAVLLVVSATEGWSAQTEEHLRIINALGLERALVAITKVDLANPSETTRGVSQRLHSSSISGSQIYPVSSVSGTGLRDLIAGLDALFEYPPSRANRPLRVWIDRAFTVKGAGTVVTGTLGRGQGLAVGDLILASQEGERTRVRAIQSSDKSVSTLIGPARVALNVDLPVHHTERGTALFREHDYRLTRVIDVRFQEAVRKAVQRNNSIQLHIGTARVSVRLRFLDDSHARLELARPLPLRVGDRGVVRDPANIDLLTGATVLGLDPPPLQSSPARRSLATLYQSAGADLSALGLVRLSMTPMLALEDYERSGYLVDSVKVVGGWVIDLEHWSKWLDDCRERLSSGASLAYPELSQALRIPDKRVYKGLLKDLGLESAPLIAIQTSQADDTKLLLALRKAPFDYLGPERFKAIEASEGALNRLIGQRKLVRIAQGVIIPTESLTSALLTARTLDQPFRVAELRESLGGTRRVVLALLAYWRDRDLVQTDGNGLHRVALLK